MAFTPGQNYVTQDPGTGMWVTIFGGQQYGPFATQSEAQQSYNNLVASFGGQGQPSGAGGYGYDPTAEAKAAVAIATLQYTYQTAYMNSYLIPQMQMLDRRERARLALDATTQYAQLFGFGMPQNFLQIMKYGMGGEMDASALGDLIPATVNISDQDMANIRTQLETAGWQGGSDDEAVDTFLKTAGNDPNQAQFVQTIQSGLLPDGAKPTIAGAEQMAAPYNQEQVMNLLGTTEGALAGAPGYKYQGQPTLAMKGIMGDPGRVPQSLMLQGMSPEQAGSFLSGTSFVKGLMGNNQPIQQPGAKFGFLQGRHLSPQTVAEWSPDQLDLTTGLAKFSGQRPDTFWWDYQQALPRGQTLGLTKIA